MKEKDKFMDGVTDQIIEFNKDPLMAWALNVAIPGLSALLCFAGAVFFVSVKWHFVAAVCLFFMFFLGRKWYVYKYKFNIRKPKA